MKMVWHGERERRVPMPYRLLPVGKKKIKKSLHDSKTALELYPDGTTELCRTHMEASLS